MTPVVQGLTQRLEEGGVLSLEGVDAAAQPFFVALWARLHPERTLLVITEGTTAQERFHQDLETWLEFAFPRSGNTPPDSPPDAPRARPLFFPAWEVLPNENRLPHVQVISERLETLLVLETRAETPGRGGACIVSHIVALMQRTFCPTNLQQRTRHLTRGMQVDPIELVEWLESQGYEPEVQVNQKGEVALRGGVLDVFPPTGRWPVRLEFLGNELESLREFDPLTQISRGEIGAVRLPPAGELGLLKRRVAAGDPATVQPPAVSLLDHLPRDAQVIICNPDAVASQAADYAQQVPTNDPLFVTWENLLLEMNRRGLTRIELHEDFSGSPLPDSPADAIPSLPTAPAAGPTSADLRPGAPRNWSASAPLFSSLDAFRPVTGKPPAPEVAQAQRRVFFHQLHRWLHQDHIVLVFCNNKGERQRFEEIWQEFGLDSGATAPTPKDESRQSGFRPVLRLGTLSRGFLCEAARLVVVTDAEIFGRYRVQRPRRIKVAQAAAMRSALEIDFADLVEGDLVVHLQYGIGRYVGLRTLPASGGRHVGSQPVPPGTECLVIEYSPRDPGSEPPKLYVPVSEAHLVSKYVGAGRARPPLNTLGGVRWKQARARAERAVRDLAAELLQIQAARAAHPGHAFAPDTPWQRELEGAFLYEETPDQLRAIEETKADMEHPKPMDRLICGDVGFGKTEVAVRATFKAVMDGKQVAVLTPTTVLAQQHFNTFRDRFADYPVRVELLSRFRTPRQQRQVLRELAAGSVDVVIGTHRLLQLDVAFKDLGLVVIDEEQRFGVDNKEQLKRLRPLVDVLTLSATPIPRTLYLALTGARDMSTIQTPPQDRLPVETIVTEYDERIIREAIQRELNRGGQVFFLHNRVQTIHAMAERLQQLVPHARLVVGHGQMASDELEEAMTRFVNGEADILLSTTIIESGLDIPNANTIIIDRADRFGLSDLYQLRGRVGRYKHQAYAYLLLPRHAHLLTNVRKRLSAMRQYAALGSGFKIAMRDLEIRGVGNLLGPEQSGHITAVGFELYCQLLQQSIATLKGESVKPRIEVALRLDFLALHPPGEATPLDEPRATSSHCGGSTPPALAGLPADYIPESRHRIQLYRKLALAESRADLEALRGELRDRFGPLPECVELLLQVAELKLLAAERGITAVEVDEDKLKLTKQGEYVTVAGKFPRLTRKRPSARLNEIKRLLRAL